MSEIKFVSAEEMTKIEDYAASLVASMASLATLESFHVKAFKLGLLMEEEEELSKSICWEIRRLITLYRTLLDKVLGNCELTEEKLFLALQVIAMEGKEGTGEV